MAQVKKIEVRDRILAAATQLFAERGYARATVSQIAKAAGTAPSNVYVYFSSKLEIVFVESGGDNLAATFSPELADLTIYVIDVAAGEKIPRKGGPGITKSDLFVINKTDLAPHVGADLGVMEADTRRMRKDRPFVMTNLKTLAGLDEVVRFIERKGLLTS